MNKKHVDKKFRVFLYFSPLIFILAIWGGIEFVQWLGIVDISTKGKIVTAILVFISAYAALYQGIKNQFKDRK